MSHARLGDVLIVGLGKSGIAAARYCAARMESGEVSSLTIYAGTRTPETFRAGQEFTVAGVQVIYDEKDVAGHFHIGIVSPGISMFDGFYLSAAGACDEFMSEPEFAYREDPEGWLAITGTNGKTTTVSLTAHLLNRAGIPARACGNIGVPCIQAVEERTGELLVAELSSYQIASMERFTAVAGACINVTADHLEWHRTFEAYRDAKRKLFDTMGEGQLAVFDIEDGRCAEMVSELTAAGYRVASVSTRLDPGTADAGWFAEGGLHVRLAGDESFLIGVEELPLEGEHNHANALTASLLALSRGATQEAIREGLKTFTPLSHRMEFVGRALGKDFYNDSKATNTDATIRALTAFEGRELTLLLGGHDKGTDLTEFCEKCVEAATTIVCYGEARERFLAAFMDTPGVEDIPLAEASHMLEALEVAIPITDYDGTILLSPACSSFDEFTSFEERGDVFKRAVHTLMEQARV